MGFASFLSNVLRLSNNFVCIDVSDKLACPYHRQSSFFKKLSYTGISLFNIGCQKLSGMLTDTSD